MPSAVKLGVIGAGSAEFSVGLIRDICLCESLAGSLVTLMDIDQERLEPVLDFAQRYVGELGADVKFEIAVDQEAALKDADFVVNTAQVGGHDFVEKMRAWAEQRGYYRGFRSVCFLNIQLMLSVARDMERLCPDAWLMQAGNPAFEGCTAMTRETGIKVCGFCHGHFAYQELAEVLGLDLDKVSAQSAGFNHWIFLTHFEYEGRDAYPLIDDWIATKAEEFWSDYHPDIFEDQMSRAAVEIYKLVGLFPIGDATHLVGWWFHTDLETQKKWYGEELGSVSSEIGWAKYLRSLDDGIEKINSAAADLSSKLTEVFPPVPSGEQHIPFMDALVNDNRVELQVNVPNRGAIEGIPDDVVVEIPAMCSVRGIQPYHIGKLPDTLMINVLYPRLLQAERLVRLSTNPDRRMLMGMILEDHRTRTWEQAVKFCRDILAHPEYKALRELADRMNPIPPALEFAE